MANKTYIKATFYLNDGKVVQKRVQVYNGAIAATFEGKTYKYFVPALVAGNIYEYRQDDPNPLLLSAKDLRLKMDMAWMNSLSNDILAVARPPTLFQHFWSFYNTFQMPFMRRSRAEMLADVSISLAYTLPEYVKANGMHVDNLYFVPLAELVSVGYGYDKDAEALGYIDSGIIVFTEAMLEMRDLGED